MNLDAFFSMKRLALELSPIHRTWSDEDFTRLFGPAVELNQYAMLEDKSAFCTWAWLSKDALEGFINRTRKLQPADWKSGDNIVLIDCVAHPGRTLALARLARKFFHPGQIATGTRTYGTGKVQRVTRWAYVA